jgi:pimeloyl-ACP methyl ester carboxylesterase
MAPNTFLLSAKSLPIVVCNGLAGTPAQFKHESELRARGFEVINTGYPDHYPDAKARRPHTIGSIVEAKAAEIERLGRPVLIVAHSFGVGIAAKSAEKLPDSVAGIYAISPASATWSRHLPWEAIRHMLSYPAALAFGKPTQLKPRECLYLRDGSDADLGTVFGWTALQLGIGWPCPRLSGLGCPVKVVIARDDHVIPFGLAMRIAEYHGVEPEVFDRGGHYLHLHRETGPKIVDQIAKMATMLSASRR